MEFLILFLLVVAIGLLGAVAYRVWRPPVTHIVLGTGDVSLEDIVTSLERAATLASKVANELEINIAEARQQFSRLVVLLDRLQMDVTAGTEADAVVASNLDALQQQAKDVDASSPTGAAADSAATGPKTRKRR